MQYLIAFLLGTLVFLSPASGREEFVEKAATPALLAQLRQGGFVLYLRHGQTDNRRADRFPDVDLADCSTQRVLSDAGRQEMREIGARIRQAGIPIGRVLASPMCRTTESARLVVGDAFTTWEPLRYSANMTREQKRPRIEALRRLLGEPVAAGSNTLLVAHAPNLDDLIGFFVRPEGTLVVFRQITPSGFEYIASIHPVDWAGLLRKPEP